MIVAGATHSYMEKQDYKLLKLKSHYCQENNYKKKKIITYFTFCEALPLSEPYKSCPFFFFFLQ